MIRTHAKEEQRKANATTRVATNKNVRTAHINGDPEEAAAVAAAAAAKANVPQPTNQP
jgi:hypothetical protein